MPHKQKITHADTITHARNHTHTHIHTHTHTYTHTHTFPSYSLLSEWELSSDEGVLANAERVSQVGFEAPYMVINTPQQTAGHTAHTTSGSQ
jgi:hypothetical protein